MKKDNGQFSDASVFDPQGRLFYRLVKQAGWTKERITTLLLKKYNAMHWNALEPKEKKGVIATMKGYVKEAQKAQSKELRQKIMGIWCRSGRSSDELHEYMVAWGFGDSLRKCNHAQLQNIKQYCKVIVYGE